MTIIDYLETRHLPLFGGFLGGRGIGEESEDNLVEGYNYQKYES